MVAGLPQDQRTDNRTTSEGYEVFPQPFSPDTPVEKPREVLRMDRTNPTAVLVPAASMRESGDAVGVARSGLTLVPGHGTHSHPGAGGCEHRALFYDDVDQYLAATAPAVLSVVGAPLKRKLLDCINTRHV